MEGAEIDGRDGEVGGEVRSRANGVWIRAIRAGGEAEAFVAEAHHVVGVERLDIGRDGGNPVCDDRRVAAAAAWLVGEFPGEDRFGGCVSRYDGLDVGFVLRLGGGGRVPCC